MCICLPNGKFNFKFSRSYPCLRKKDSKNKHNLTLIEESSEEEEIHHKPVISNGNGLKKETYNKIPGEYANHQGHYRQLSRDRQLPPVPDSGEFPALQNNSLRKPSLKQKHKKNESVNAGQDPSRQNMEEYGSISESETYGESRSNVQSPINVPPGTFKLATADEIKDVDPLYASVVPQTKRSDIKEKSNNAQNYDNDKFLINHLNDHGYSMIIKKSSVNEFSSLRKPDRSKTLSKEHCHQSLQSLNNPAPGLPIRLYKQSELFHLNNGNRTNNDSEIKMRENRPLTSGSNSFRRFSQPPSITEQRSYPGYSDDSNKQDHDILKSLQSTYNTPPIKRASLTNICHIGRHDSDSNLNTRPTIRETNRVSSNEIVPDNMDSGDLYRKITVRESLASLRERNALPDDTIIPTTAPAALHHVYEGLYETLYYSSADNGRNAPPVEVARVRFPIIPQSPNPLQYLGQDNYLSITENPLAINFSTNSNLITRSGSLDRPINDRSSVIYTAAGSDVYAEISDIYQSKQDEDLPDGKPPSKYDGGQINNGFIGCSSPGSVRVLLEIQSFRHMDSDVDISSRCTTPLHPYGKSIVNGAKSTSYKSAESNESHSAPIRHPWYLPQKTSLSSQSMNGKPPISSLSNKAPITKPKTPQSNLAIMTPLMERSMEGSSMFLNESKNSQSGIDCLYDLFKLDSNSDSLSRASTVGESERIKPFQNKSSSPEENKAPSPDINTKMKRNIYPRFSGSNPQ